MQRVKQVAAHITGSSQTKGLPALEQKHDDDVVITMAIRSPLCKAWKGGLKDATTDELFLEMFKARSRPFDVRPLVQDICVGTVLTPSSMYPARTAALAAGFPESTAVQTINRFCSSGLMAVTDIGNKIRAGQIEIGLAVGIDSMSQNPDDGSPPQSGLVSCNQAAKDCTEKMGWTSENVAVDFGITRDEQDAFAARSFQRAERAQAAGYFKKEIVPFTVYQKDRVTGEKKLVTVTEDDGIRKGTTKEGLAKIRAAFPQWGNSTTTGGNASQLTDGAAAVLLMTRRKARELGLTILAKYITTAVTGLAPRIMGIGPTYAIPIALKQAGITVEDVDIFEINEAFASMAVYSQRTLSIPAEKLNPNGGARQIATGLNELHRSQGKVLVTSMCIGTGMGAAAVFVRD
ncbi:hypothetical protein D9611_001645 [Ephemerocybe angulata]|uniref:3-ketoacyl-CoA thiolase n=1 Tax=Ephemerocybe angulata TaxID=980116 RepID=A0A8H5CHB2_9AGAR|nr:hypothetical protein D9611_001645 [Tulosesus angulatus]